MPRRVSAISCAALVTAVLSSGCGGGHAVRATSATARPQPSTSAPAAPAPTQSTGTTLPPAGAYWPYAKLIGSLSGRTLALARGPVHLNGALIECNGGGAPVKSGPTRRWSHYTCTQTLFQNGVDRDVTFEVTILSATRLRITSARYGAE